MQSSLDKGECYEKPDFTHFSERYKTWFFQPDDAAVQILGTRQTREKQVN